MRVLSPRLGSVTSDEDMAREEARMKGMARAIGIISISLAGVMAAALVLVQARQSWEYVAYPLGALVPVGCALLGGYYVWSMHVGLLRRHQVQLVLRSAELQEMASKDELTGLYNRRYFYDFISAELEKARTGKVPLALVMMDVDGLKAINDEYGHTVGDAIIANLAKVIVKHVRNTDVAARLGGDEFGVVMPGTDKRGAFALARRLWEELEHTPMYEKDGTRVMVTVSIGVSGFPWGGEDVDEMMQWADTDMYANKVSRHLPPRPVAVEGRRELDTLPDEYVAGI